MIVHNPVPHTMMERRNSMKTIRINTLHSLESVKDYYIINSDLQVINTQTNYIKKPWKNADGYPCVTLETTQTNCAVNVPMHKIVALAFIENRAHYELIEHLNDVKDDYSISNLMFSNHSANGKRAYTNGCVIRNEHIYELVLNDNTVLKDTMKNLERITGISKMTLYDNIYVDRIPRKFKSIKQID